MLLIYGRQNVGITAYYYKKFIENYPVLLLNDNGVLIDIDGALHGVVERALK